MSEIFVVEKTIFGIGGPGGMTVDDMPAGWVAIQYFNHYSIETSDPHITFREIRNDDVAFTWCEPHYRNRARLGDCLRVGYAEVL